MKHNEASIFIFIASIIVGILISMNISFNDSNTRVFLSSKQYVDAYNQKIKLIGEISELKGQYEKYNEKFYKYTSPNHGEGDVVNEINKELQEGEAISGKVAVEGEGIKITMMDASYDFSENAIERSLKLIHNNDIISVMNDLRNAGVEAISINNQRVIDRTEVYCSGPFLRINGIKVPQPFYIEVIGNKDTLYNYMLSDENYLKSLILRKINVSVEKEETINISAYDRNISTEYMSIKK